MPNTIRPQNHEVNCKRRPDVKLKCVHFMMIRQTIRPHLLQPNRASAINIQEEKREEKLSYVRIFH